MGVGTGNLSVSKTGAGAAAMGAIAATGVDQSAPIGNAYTAIATSTTPGVNVTNDVDDDLIVDVLAMRNEPTVTATAPQTQRWNALAPDNPASDSVRGAGSTRVGLLIPPTSLGWTADDSQAWAMIGSFLKSTVKRAGFSGQIGLSGAIGSRAFDFEIESRLTALEQENQRLRRRLRF
jgi:hypothetical protein